MIRIRILNWLLSGEEQALRLVAEEASNPEMPMGADNKSIISLSKGQEGAAE